MIVALFSSYSSLGRFSRNVYTPACPNMLPKFQNLRFIRSVRLSQGIDSTYFHALIHRLLWMEKGSIGFYVPPPVTMTTPNQPQPLTDEEILQTAQNLLENPGDLIQKELATLGTFCSADPEVRPHLKDAVLEIFQALDWRLAQKQRREQEQEELLARALAAKKQVLTGDLSGVSPEELPAILAGLNPEETTASLWIILARVAIAQDQARKRDLAEMLFYSPSNTFCFGMRRKFSRTKILGIIDAFGEEAEDKVAYFPPEEDSLWWLLFSRNSRAFKKANRKAKAAAAA